MILHHLTDLWKFLVGFDIRNASPSSFGSIDDHIVTVKNPFSLWHTHHKEGDGKTVPL